MFTDQEFRDIKTGQRVGAVCGPGEFPQSGFCREGKVTEKLRSGWGNFCLIVFDGGGSDRMYGITKKGIGFYLL
jgi:hypothetical protein